jgi:hypothetical protein
MHQLAKSLPESEIVMLRRQIQRMGQSAGFGWTILFGAKMRENPFLDLFRHYELNPMVKRLAMRHMAQMMG